MFVVGAANEPGNPARAWIADLTIADGRDNDEFYLGGGVLCRGGSELTLTGCTLRDNEAMRSNIGGGGVFINESTVTLTNCTLTRNRAYEGGGVKNYAGVLRVTNCTFAGNSAAYRGAGIWSGGRNGARTEVYNSVFADAAGGALFQCDVPKVTGDHNLTPDGTAPGGHSLLKTNARLGPLGRYGGPTETLPLLTGSPALNAGDNGACRATPTPTSGACRGSLATGSISARLKCSEARPGGLILLRDAAAAFQGRRSRCARSPPDAAPLDRHNIFLFSARFRALWRFKYGKRKTPGCPAVRGRRVRSPRPVLSQRLGMQRCKVMRRARSKKQRPILLAELERRYLDARQLLIGSLKLYRLAKIEPNGLGVFATISNTTRNFLRNGRTCMRPFSTLRWLRSLIQNNKSRKSARRQAPRPGLLLERLEDRLAPAGTELLYAATDGTPLTLRLANGNLQLVPTANPSAQPLAQQALSLTSDVLVKGAGYDVRLTIDTSVPAVSGGIVFQGGSGPTALVASNAANVWTVNGAASGDLNGLVRFVGVKTLVGGPGDDTYRFDADNQLGGITLDETAGGTATLDFSATSAGVSVDLSRSGQQKVNDNLQLTLGNSQGFLNLIGGSGNDKLTGNDANNVITAGPGNDTLSGGGGDNTYVLGPNHGSDTINGNTDSSSGTDTLDVTAVSADTTVRMTDDGTFTLSSGGSVQAKGVRGLRLGGGNNTLDYSQYPTGVNVDLSRGRATGLVSPSGVRNLIGSPHDDILIGDGNANRIQAGNGNDTLSGNGGDDTLVAGGGSDTLSEYANASLTLTNNSLVLSTLSGTTTETLQGTFATAQLTGGADTAFINASAFSGKAVLDAGVNVPLSVLNNGTGVRAAYKGDILSLLGKEVRHPAVRPQPGRRRSDRRQRPARLPGHPDRRHHVPRDRHRLRHRPGSAQRHPVRLQRPNQCHPRQGHRCLSVPDRLAEGRRRPERPGAQRLAGGGAAGHPPDRLRQHPGRHADYRRPL